VTLRSRSIAVEFLIGLIVATRLTIGGQSPNPGQTDASISPGNSPAQTPAETSTSNPPPASEPPAIDPTKLGVSFERVRMQLAQPAPANIAGLKLQETIEVVGKAPQLFLWDPKTANLTGPAPFGPPTQRDFRKVIVPRELQTYPFDLSALTQWLMQHLSKKSEE
jgi:hypothetical protein